MVSPFDQAFEASAAPVFDNWFSATIQLKRGGDTSEEFEANWASQEYQAPDHETGPAIAVRKRVYRFLKTSAVINSETVTPRAGDAIIDGSETMRIAGVGEKPAVEEEPGGYRWLARTDKLA